MFEIDIETLLQAAEPLIELALQEDIGPGDATAQSTLDAGAVLQGRIVAKAPGVIAGLPVAEAVFRRVDPAIVFRALATDGQEVVAGECVAEARGPGPALLAAERTALNFLQRMSGIATQTRAFVDAVATTRAAILDTRKTLPGHRVLDKYAVRMGGGLNHRMGLYDMLLVKDNHIDAAGGLIPAVCRARGGHPGLPIEVEVRTMAELQDALSIDPPLDRIMLDNMTLQQMREAVAVCAGRVPLEASGGVTLTRVADIAATGVDYISTGAITHSVEALDLSMKVAPRPGGASADPGALIRAAKTALGDRLLVLGHHYQRDDVLEFADLRGDSLELSRAAAQTDASEIVFCGVHFMAETAAVLAKPGQRVYIPDPSAGCYLADTATVEAVEHAWGILDAAVGNADAEFTPITYVNSSAPLKAFCGAHGGIVCTSGNAARVLGWALKQRPRVFFFPDQHLGGNTALALGIAPERIMLWDRWSPPDATAIQGAAIVLWPGACNVHQRFRPEHVEALRERYPGIRIAVHPECRAELVAMADSAGSTAQMIRWVGEAPAGTQWALGTENRLVARLQQEHPEQLIVSLADVPPFCATMGQVTLQNLAQLLDGLRRGEVVSEVIVEPETAQWARAALEKMLAL